MGGAAGSMQLSRPWLRMTRQLLQGVLERDELPHHGAVCRSSAKDFITPVCEHFRLVAWGAEPGSIGRISCSIFESVLLAVTCQNCLCVWGEWKVILWSLNLKKKQNFQTNKNHVSVLKQRSDCSDLTEFSFIHGNCRLHLRIGLMPFLYWHNIMLLKWPDAPVTLIDTSLYQQVTLKTDMLLADTDPCRQLSPLWWLSYRG